MQGRVSSAAAAYLVQDENLQNSDLQPGKYEGTLSYPEWHMCACRTHLHHDVLYYGLVCRLQGASSYGSVLLIWHSTFAGSTALTSLSLARLIQILSW